MDRDALVQKLRELEQSMERMRVSQAEYAQEIANFRTRYGNVNNPVVAGIARVALVFFDMLQGVINRTMAYADNLISEMQEAISNPFRSDPAIISHLAGFLSYEEIANGRLVSPLWNKVLKPIQQSKSKPKDPDRK